MVIGRSLVKRQAPGIAERRPKSRKDERLPEIDVVDRVPNSSLAADRWNPPVEADQIAAFLFVF